jgi:hypothetical protein
MKIWNTLVKRSVLALVAATVALTWTQTGHAQAPCLIERGQDPLDVLNSGVRHNVWIILDASGSMGQRFTGNRNKMQVAKDVINQLMDELVDAAGAPLVNWAFSYYDRNSAQSPYCGTADNNGDGYPDEPGTCIGLKDGAFVQPGTCGNDSREAVRQVLNGVSAGGSTPVGTSYIDLASYMTGNHVDNSFDFTANLLPNQKNFIIQVSDGQDTCECNQYGYDVPTLDPDTDGNPDVPLRASSTSSAVTGYSEGSGQRRAYNAGLKGEEALKQIDPNLDGTGGNLFLIGMDLDKADKELLNTIAWMASGAHLPNGATRDAAGLTHPAFFADNPQQLVDAFRNILAKIGIPDSEVTLGSPEVGTVREVIQSHTNQFLQRSDHEGDVGPNFVDPDDIQQARTVRANHQNNVLFNTSIEIPGFRGHFNAYNIYRVTDDANQLTARVPDFTKLWDAGEVLQQRSPDSRNILFNKRGQTNLLPFDTNNVTAGDLGVAAGYLAGIDGFGARTNSDARDMVVGVVRGYRLSIDPLTGTLYKTNGDINFSTTDGNGNNTWKLYDTLTGLAVVQNPPRSPDFDPPQNHANEYGVGGTQVGDGFYWDHFNRETMVYLPTNIGMMHGFAAETGEEVFAYIPGDVVGIDNNEVAGSRDTLRDVVELIVADNNGITNHQFTMSGSPTVSDAFLRSDHGGDDAWHTMLVFGRGRGGRFISGLDITDPSNPVLRFNRGNSEGTSDGLYDGLGETWSTAVMGNVQTSTNISNPDTIDQWLAFFGGGYGCASNGEGPYLFAIRLEDGEVYHRAQATSDPAAPLTDNAIVGMPTLYNPHQEDVQDRKDYTTRAYVGDLQGTIWKLVTLDVDPANWTFGKFAELGLDQPITAGVTLLADHNNQQVYVMAGSGGDLRVDSAATDFKFAAFIDADAEGANTTQYPLGSTPFWELALNPDQRVYVPPVTVGKIGDPIAPVVFFAASKPEFDAGTCESEFASSLYALGVLSGQAEVDLDGGGNDTSVDLGNNKVTGLDVADGNLYVSESGGLGASGELDVYGDGDFSDDAGAGGTPWATVQVLIDSFRVSPF